MNSSILILLCFLIPVLAQSDPCLRKPDPGPCTEFSEHYFYNSATQSCEAFTWGGCDGVVPFANLQECEAAQCGVPRCEQSPDRGPCRAFAPRYFYNQTSEQCEEFIWGGCSGNVPFGTLQSCNSECRPQPCDLKPDPGPCRQSVPRYFYNATSMMCEEFTYGGCEGVVPFVTLADCQTAQCGVPRCEQRPDPGPCRALAPRYFYNQTSEKCEQFFWGGCGGNVPFDSLEKCNNGCTTKRCFLKPDPGPCRAAIPRYFYNATSMMCEEFTYGGCQGVVPFETFSNCEKTCDNPCVKRRDPGPCEGLFPRYFFNVRRGKCRQFTWGGCDGSVPFETRHDCQQAECNVYEELLADMTPEPSPDAEKM